MEFGPRALGARSIIGDARSPKMQAVMNLKIKFRESFRPFAPAVPGDDVSDYFEIDRSSPYMLLVAYVRPERRRIMTEDEERLWGIDKLNIVRSRSCNYPYRLFCQTPDRSRRNEPLTIV
jgi:carbamoyltransferase